NPPPPPVPTLFPYTTLFRSANAPGGASENGSRVTITTTAAHNFTVGQEVLIGGVAVAGYNGGPFIITSVPSATTFTYTATQTGLDRKSTRLNSSHQIISYAL